MTEVIRGGANTGTHRRERFGGRESDEKRYSHWLNQGAEVWFALPEDFDNPPPGHELGGSTQVGYYGRDRRRRKFVPTTVERMLEGQRDQSIREGQNLWVRNATLTTVTTDRRMPHRNPVEPQTDIPAPIDEPPRMEQAEMPGFEESVTGRPPRSAWDDDY